MRIMHGTAGYPFMQADNKDHREGKPDVEQIIAEIHAGIRRARDNNGPAAEPTPAPGALDANNLYACLKAANQTHRVELPPAEGLKGRLRTRLYALLAHSFESINRHQLVVLHILNKLVKVLDGSNDELTGELLTQTRNRMDLTESLSKRIADLERQVAALEKRLADKDAR